MDTTAATRDRAGSYRRLADGIRAFLPRPLPPDPPLDMDEPLQMLLSSAERSVWFMRSSRPSTRSSMATGASVSS